MQYKQKNDLFDFTSFVFLHYFPHFWPNCDVDLGAPLIKQQKAMWKGGGTNIYYLLDTICV